MFDSYPISTEMEYELFMLTRWGTELYPLMILVACGTGLLKTQITRVEQILASEL